MGPTKAIVKEQALYEAATGKFIKDGFANQQAIDDYVKRHYLALPVVDNAGNAWLLEGRPVYCFRGSQYETIDDQRVHLARCPDCGGMGIRSDEFTVESDCIRCVSCEHEFDARLEMMET
ncbi:MAG TPA: hypothetical protein VJM82_01260 [Nitrospiraceae bacterium]|nr:hypothetical protein [Nitrospiraceae bacterium]